VSILISSHILAELEALCKSILILSWGRILASGSQREIRSDIKNWSEELSIQCDAPEKLARHLFDAGVLVGFDMDAQEGLLNIRVKDAPDFYARWTGLLLESNVTVQAIRSESRSLKNIFDKVTS
jgi:ABC-type multidrug transport system ATPase subunit